MTHAEEVMYTAFLIDTRSDRTTTYINFKRCISTHMYAVRAFERLNSLMCNSIIVDTGVDA